jgi:HlyD family secretion protein
VTNIDLCHENLTDLSTMLVISCEGCVLKNKLFFEFEINERLMIKKIILLILFIALISFVWSINKPKILSVQTQAVTTGLTQATVVNTRAGTITACQRSKLALAIGGQIAAIKVQEGQQVKRGEVLLSLWNKDLKANVNSATAGVSAAEYSKQSLCIQANSDQREAVRQENLIGKNLTSQGQVDLAQAKANASAAACTGANAHWQQAQAILAQAQAMLEKTYLIAPFSGTVAHISGEIGEFSTPSPPGVPTPPAIDLITSDCHYITAPIDEVDAGKIAIGMQVNISLDAFRGQIFQGKVRRIAPFVQDYAKQARTVEIEVDFIDNKHPKLLAGYSVDVEIILASSSKNIRIPSDAIIDNNFVYLLNTNGFIEKRNISTGLTNWQFTEVTQGLNKGEQLITNSMNITNIEAGLAAKSQRVKADD